MSKFTLKKYRSWKQIPLALQIVISIILAASVGTLLGGQAANNPHLINHLATPCNLILKALRALATPLIMLALLHAFLTADCYIMGYI